MRRAGVLSTISTAFYLTFQHASAWHVDDDDDVANAAMGESTRIDAD